MKIDVIRTYYSENYTKGLIFVNDVFFGYTLEPQKKATNETSFLNRCIDTGTYIAEYEYSPKFKKHLIELKNVPNHTEIKIHAGNFRKDTRGCILMGRRSDVGCVLDSKIMVDMLNMVARDAKNVREKIEVEVRDLLSSDDRVDFDKWQNSRK